ncbi:MAG: VanZ family protein [Victivallaceae bacterium]
MKFDKKVILSWLAAGLWMTIIFVFSAQPAEESENVSMGITSIIVIALKSLGLIADANALWLDYIIRKLAHAFVFFVLAMLVVNAFLKTGAKGIKAFIFAFVFTALYACSDEFHQIYVPGRACMWSDMIIDSLGAIFGLGVFAIAWKRRQAQKLKER